MKMTPEDTAKLAVGMERAARSRKWYEIGRALHGIGTVLILFAIGYCLPLITNLFAANTAPEHVYHLAQLSGLALFYGGVGVVLFIIGQVCGMQALTMIKKANEELQGLADMVKGEGDVLRDDAVRGTDSTDGDSSKKG